MEKLKFLNKKRKNVGKDLKKIVNRGSPTKNVKSYMS